MTPSLATECWFLSGPTASGKTAVSLALAQRLDAEIVSMDSMALYRGMDIGTAKPGPVERQVVPHHLIDILDPHQDFSVASYVAEAGRISADVRSCGRQVLFVGGTPLYLKALLRGIFVGPPADWPFRRRLEAIAEQEGPGALHDRLANVDPLTAQRLHAGDTRRVIRALEVAEKTGRPISELQQQFDHAHTADQTRVFVLAWPRDVLNQRINARVDQMFDSGLVEEVRTLLESGPLGRTASQAVGYREVIEHLQGDRSLSETIELVKQRTRQFAKRQMTWFRSLSECRMIELVGEPDSQALANQIAATGSNTK